MLCQRTFGRGRVSCLSKLKCGCSTRKTTRWYTPVDSSCASTSSRTICKRADAPPLRTNASPRRSVPSSQADFVAARREAVEGEHVDVWVDPPSPGELWPNVHPDLEVSCVGRCAHVTYGLIREWNRSAANTCRRRWSDLEVELRVARRLCVVFGWPVYDDLVLSCRPQRQEDDQRRVGAHGLQQKLWHGCFVLL
jgi:hypothetical protein